jgi:quercetin dioxygenase-like cupin family protein
MPDESPFDAASLVASVETAAGFWQMGILWTPLISGESTRGTYSLMEQLMPAKAGPPPHVHDQGEEVFYILDGEMPGAQRPATTDR